jgi:Leucine-rich repeat (LRR) protein
LSNNGFAIYLPSDQLSHVECLNLQNNDIVTIPPEVLKMTQLKELNLSNNPTLMDVTDVVNLTNLEKLHLR